MDGLVLRDRDTDANGTLDERLYALQDANWNTTALVNISGTVQERYTYSPFGQVTFRDGSGSTLSGSAKDWVFLHQGGERIAAGDYEFRNRVYSPSLGRWLSNDPLGFDAGDQNWYRTIGNNPGNGNDPSGLIWPILVLGGAAIGWLVTSPPPVQAPTKDGEAVFPPLDIGEKIGGVTVGLGVGAGANLALSGTKVVIRQLAREEESKASELPPILYRGERPSREPSQVFKEGITPKGNNTNLEKHIGENLKDSNFIATSTLPHGALGFAQRNGWVYVIRTPKNGIDVSKALPNSPLRIAEQNEVAIPGGIPVENIIGAYRIREYKFTDEFIRNPAFKP